ncbi:MAG: hypothetical protein U1A23_01545, partial [Candidatus Sungbacteria bacterium]|nr:hypothetical protein [bacterium]MDZ4285590.1 hypothetical protein [Candidatus Sungbacteria bacterium]
ALSIVLVFSIAISARASQLKCSDIPVPGHLQLVSEKSVPIKTCGFISPRPQYPLQGTPLGTFATVADVDLTIDSIEVKEYGQPPQLSRSYIGGKAVGVDASISDGGFFESIPSAGSARAGWPRGITQLTFKNGNFKIVVSGTVYHNAAWDTYHPFQNGSWADNHPDFNHWQNELMNKELLGIGQAIVAAVSGAGGQKTEAETPIQPTEEPQEEETYTQYRERIEGLVSDVFDSIPVPVIPDNVTHEQCSQLCYTDYYYNGLARACRVNKDKLGGNFQSCEISAYQRMDSCYTNLCGFGRIIATDGSTNVILRSEDIETTKIPLRDLSERQPRIRAGSSMGTTNAIFKLDDGNTKIDADGNISILLDLFFGAVEDTIQIDRAHIPTAKDILIDTELTGPIGFSYDNIANRWWEIEQGSRTLLHLSQPTLPNPNVYRFFQVETAQGIKTVALKKSTLETDLEKFKVANTTFFFSRAEPHSILLKKSFNRSNETMTFFDRIVLLSGVVEVIHPNDSDDLEGIQTPLGTVLSVHTRFWVAHNPEKNYSLVGVREGSVSVTHSFTGETITLEPKENGEPGIAVLLGPSTQEEIAITTPNNAWRWIIVILITGGLGYLAYRKRHSVLKIFRKQPIQ